MSKKKGFGQVQSKESRHPFWIFWNNIELGIGIVCLALMTVITFVNVLTRYIFLFSFPWAEEVCRFLLVWMTFGGAAYAFRMGVNISVEYFVNKLPDKYIFVMGIISKISVIVLFAIVFFTGYNHVAQQIARGQVSTAARIPMAIPSSALPIGSFMVIVRVGQQIVSDLYHYFKREGEAA